MREEEAVYDEMDEAQYAKLVKKRREEGGASGGGRQAAGRGRGSPA